MAEHVESHGFITVGDFFDRASDVVVDHLDKLARKVPEEIQGFTEDTELFDKYALSQISTLAMILRHGEGDPIMNADSIWIGAQLLCQYLFIENTLRKTNEIEELKEARKKYTLIDYVSY